MNHHLELHGGDVSVFAAHLNEHGKHSISVKALRAGQSKKIHVFWSGEDRAK
jgi:hypothetical protein